MGRALSPGSTGKTRGGDAEWEKRKADAINKGKL